MNNFTVIEHLFYLSWTIVRDYNNSRWIIANMLFLYFLYLEPEIHTFIFTGSPHRLSPLDYSFKWLHLVCFLSSLLSLSCFPHTRWRARATTSRAEAELNLQEAFMACNIYIGVSPGFATDDLDLCYNQYRGTSGWAHYDNSILTTFVLHILLEALWHCSAGLKCL